MAFFERRCKTAIRLISFHQLVRDNAFDSLENNRRLYVPSQDIVQFATFLSLPRLAPSILVFGRRSAEGIYTEMQKQFSTPGVY